MKIHTKFWQKFSPVLVIALFGALFVIAIMHLMYEATVFVDQQIKQDMAKLGEIFQKIDKACRIINFAEPRNAINFLNVKKFVGKELGPMQLMFPDRWPGPFVKENFAVFGEPYLVVRQKDGYFITPPAPYAKKHAAIKVPMTGVQGPMLQTILAEEE